MTPSMYEFRIDDNDKWEATCQFCGATVSNFDKLLELDKYMTGKHECPKPTTQ